MKFISSCWPLIRKRGIQLHQRIPLRGRVERKQNKYEKAHLPKTINIFHERLKMLICDNIGSKINMKPICGKQSKRSIDARRLDSECWMKFSIGFGWIWKLSYTFRCRCRKGGNGYRAISGQNQYDAHLPQTIKKIYAIGLTGRYPFFSQNAKTPRGAYLFKEVLASPLIIIGT